MATVACLARTVSSLLRDCWSVVSRLSLARGRPLPLGRGVAFRDALRANVKALDDADGVARREWSRTSTAAEQARAIARLPAGYREAAASLAPLASASPGLAQEIVGALRQTGAAHGSLLRSLRHADRDAYTRARALVVERRAQLKRLLDQVFSPKT